MSRYQPKPLQQLASKVLSTVPPAQLVAPITDEGLQQLENSDHEIDTLDVSYASNQINIQTCVTQSVEEVGSLRCDEETHKRVRKFNLESLLEIINHIIPRNTGETRTIKLLQVTFPCFHTRVRITLSKVFEYWASYKSSLEPRKGELILNRFKLVHMVGMVLGINEERQPEKELKGWIEKNIPVRIGALTIVPQWIHSQSSRCVQNTMQQFYLNYLSLKQVLSSGATAEGVGIAVFPLLLTSDSNTPLPSATRTLQLLCPKSHLVPLYKDNPFDQCSLATSVENMTKYWLEKREELGLNSFVLLIRCSRGFREDAMRAINDAVSEGIIVVCAAGVWTSISFPGSMGNVICVGVPDENGSPAPYSPSGREIDWLIVTPSKETSEIGYHGFIKPTTSDAAVIGTCFIALLCCRVGKLLGVGQSIHTSVIKEILKETTQYHTHEAHRGYGCLTTKIFSFSDSKLRKILSAITTGGRSPDVTVSAQPLVEQCKHNTEAFANEELNRRMDVGVILEGKDIKILIIDDDFPEAFLGEHETNSLEEEIVQFNEKATMLWKQLESLEKLASSMRDLLQTLREDEHDWFEGAIESLEKTADSLEDEMCSLDAVAAKYTPIHESHGLKCALVITNMLPKAKLLLMNSSGEDDDSTNLAETIGTVVNENRPDILVCSMAFDNFNPKLAKAFNDAINKGVIPVVTAGNIGQISRNTISYPAKLGNAICIGAHSPYGAIQAFSSVGREVDFLAPGEFMILDKFPVSGTSFAAPAAAAMIALILEYAASKVVVEEENGRYAHVRAWSEYPLNSGNWQWEMRPIHQVCRNVHVMRQVLKHISLNPTAHRPGSGHGLIDITRLAIDLNPTDLHRIVQEINIFQCKACLARPIPVKL